MAVLRKIFYDISAAYDNSQLITTLILSVLLMVLILGLYEFAVYRLVSHRAFFNRSFSICIAVLPFFIATIILCLQSNIVITLGTIGALAILRFRTAVKDPVDMLYLLWSVHTGIVCGCQLYEVAVLTSLMVTIVLLAMEYTPMGKRPQILIVHCPPEVEPALLERIEEHTKRYRGKDQGTNGDTDRKNWKDALLGWAAEHAGQYRVKSRNYTSRGLDLVVELNVRKPEDLCEELRALGAEKFSIVEYDCDNIL